MYLLFSITILLSNDLMNDKTDLEIGVMDVIFEGDWNYMKRYKVRGYVYEIPIATKEEFDDFTQQFSSQISKDGKYFRHYRIEKYNNYVIMLYDNQYLKN